MKVNKWNCKKQEYEPYEVPPGWYITLIEDDLNKIVNCAECGKEIKFGDSYTSKLIHTDFGLGYCVCEECNNKQWDEYWKSIMEMEE